MTQTNLPGPPGHARFCSSCGGALSGPVPRCPRCGAEVGGKRKSSSSALTIIIVSVAVLGAIPCLGILAAIAIPNFVRYQLRAKEAGVKAELEWLVRAEQAAFQKTGRFVALGPLPAAPPGARKSALSAEDEQVAASLAWEVPKTTYGQYRVAVAADGGSAALCAESDLDGDGVRAVRVAFLPSAPGTAEGAPPAPCSTPVPYDPQALPGEVVQLTERNVF